MSRNQQVTYFPASGERPITYKEAIQQIIYALENHSDLEHLKAEFRQIPAQEKITHGIVFHVSALHAIIQIIKMTDLTTTRNEALYFATLVINEAIATDLSLAIKQGEFFSRIRIFYNRMLQVMFSYYDAHSFLNFLRHIPSEYIDKTILDIAQKFYRYKMRKSNENEILALEQLKTHLEELKNSLGMFDTAPAKSSPATVVDTEGSTPRTNAVTDSPASAQQSKNHHRYFNNPYSRNSTPWIVQIKTNTSLPGAKGP